MFERNVSLDVGCEDLALIEAALHTQTKILRVQASAGGVAARTKLEDVKRLLAVVESKRPGGQSPCKRSFFSLPLLRRIVGRPRSAT